FLIADGICVSGGCHAWNWQLPMKQTFHVGMVFVRSDQFVLATAHEIVQIEKKLAHICRANEIGEMKLTNALPKIDPKVLVIEHPKLTPGPNQQVVAVGMKGADPQS